jgi:hypothetical protein
MGNFASFAFFAVKIYRKTRKKTQKRNSGQTFQNDPLPLKGLASYTLLCDFARGRMLLFSPSLP